MKPSPIFMVYERTLENCHGYRPCSASSEDQRELEKSTKRWLPVPLSPESSFKKKKCLHQRRSCFSNSKGKTPGLMRLLHRFLAGLFLPHPSSPCSIII